MPEPIAWVPGHPTGIDADGAVVVVCEQCGSPDVNFDGHDIDKCNVCGHWRYRGRPRGESS